jgi:hypothetical protein
MEDAVRAVPETTQSRMNLARQAENPGSPSGLTRPKTAGALEQVVLPSFCYYEYKLIICQARDETSANQNWNWYILAHGLW